MPVRGPSDANYNLFLFCCPSNASSWSTFGSLSSGHVGAQHLGPDLLLVSLQPNPYSQSLADPNQSPIPAARSPSPAHFIICRKASSLTSRCVLASLFNHLFCWKLIMKVPLRTTIYFLGRWEVSFLRLQMRMQFRGLRHIQGKHFWREKSLNSLKKSHRNPVVFSFSSSGLLPSGLATANHLSPCLYTTLSTKSVLTATDFMSSIINHLILLPINSLSLLRWSPNHLSLV